MPMALSYEGGSTPAFAAAGLELALKQEQSFPNCRATFFSLHYTIGRGTYPCLKSHLCVFILPSTTAGQLPPARHYDSTPHAGPRLSSHSAGLPVRAGAVHHRRRASDGLPGPPEAHHIHVGGECTISCLRHALRSWASTVMPHLTSSQGSAPCHHLVLGPVSACLCVEYEEHISCPQELL